MSGISLFPAPNLDANQVHAALKASQIVLVDVRERDEYSVERIEGATNIPLSQFDPAAQLVTGGKAVVLHCQGGSRSARALEACQRAGVDIRYHLQGGINAWKAAGLPTVR